MEKQISIIIPTYNMEKYIGRCLDSLLIPEIDQVEVLVVNDGSKDRSSEIAHSYADRYPDSIRVIDKPNGNYGSCINAVLPLCTGRYVKVLDADDTFDTQAFSRFVQCLVEISSDVVLTTFSRVDQEGKKYMTVDFNADQLPWGQSIDLYKSFHNLSHKLMQMHSIAYHRDLFNRFRYFQLEGISYTDTLWSIIPLSRCSSVVFLNISLYQYFVGREGATTQVDQLRKAFNQLFTIAKYLTNSYESFNGNGIQRKLFMRQICNYHRVFYRQMMMIMDSNIANCLKEYDEFLKKNFRDSIYKFVNDTPYSEECRFKIIKSFRHQGYPSNYSVPKLVWFRHAIIFKAKSLLRWPKH